MFCSTIIPTIGRRTLARAVASVLAQETAAAFFAHGGFNPLLPNGDDVDLLRRLTLHEEMAHTPALVACVGIGVEASSVTWERHAEETRRGREWILSQPGVFARLRASAAGDSYWLNRMSRIYLSSVLWNLQHRCFLTAASRAGTACLSLARAGRHLFLPSYWKSLGQPHSGRAFSQGEWLAGGH